MPVVASQEPAADLSTPVGQVRLLINDLDTTDVVFSDAEITAFLAMEGDVVKLAAAQALDTIADDEALTSKVIRTQDLSADGPKVADSLRKRAQVLRDQVDADDEGYFEVVAGSCYSWGPELTDRAAVCWP